MKKKLTATDIVCRIVERNKHIREITFAAYFYIPKSLSDKGILRLYTLRFPTAERIRTFVGQLGKRLQHGWMLGVTSRITLKNGAIRHIPQIDFACSCSSRNLRRSRECVRRFARRKDGYILASGRSYHYYGTSLLTEREWEVFIGSCILCNAAEGGAVVDTRWFAYSMRRGFSNLRVTASKSKPEPAAVANI